MARSVDRSVDPELRWPAAIAIAVALALYLAQPDAVLTGIRWIVAGVLLLMLVPLFLLNPHRLHRQTTWSRRLGVGFAVLLVLANTLAIVELVTQLVNGSNADGPRVLLAALQVWVTNVIAFALVYWEMDRGGPIDRRHVPRDQLPAADFRFPQDEDHDAVTEVAARSSKSSDWVPGYVDYLYFSASNSMAFSPTDTMPLSPRAKGLMLVEAFEGFVVLALVIARAVSLLG